MLGRDELKLPIFSQSTPTLGVWNWPFENVVMPESCQPPANLSRIGSPPPKRLPFPKGSSPTLAATNAQNAQNAQNAVSLVFQVVRFY